jgi:hypothetical protein
MKILSKTINDDIEFSIEDGVNNLGVKFSLPKSVLATDAGLEKILNFIAEYVSANYECLHKKNDRGVSYLK